MYGASLWKEVIVCMLFEGGMLLYFAASGD